MHPALETVPGFGEPCGLPIYGVDSQEAKVVRAEQGRGVRSRRQTLWQKRGRFRSQRQLPKGQKRLKGLGEVWLCHTSHGFFLLFHWFWPWVFRGSSRQRTSWVSSTWARKTWGWERQEVYSQFVSSNIYSFTGMERHGAQKNKMPSPSRELRNEATAQIIFQSQMQN